MNALDSMSSMMPQFWRPFDDNGRLAPVAVGTTPAGNAPGGGPANPPGGDTATPLTKPATDLLQALGSSLAALSGIADSLRARLESMLGDTSSATAIASAANLRINQRANLEFVTQEGDVVELSVRNRASIATSSATVNDASGSATLTQTRVVTSSRLSVEVHGNLNSDELAAIQDVLTQVESLADKFFSGDVQAAFAASASLHIDSTQLASVALDLAQRQRFDGAAVAVTEPRPAPLPAPTSTSPSPSTSTPTPTPATSPTDAASPTGAASPVDTASPAGSAAPLPASVQPAAGYLAQALSQLRSAATIELSMKYKLQLLVLAVAVPATPAASDSSAADASGKSANRPTTGQLLADSAAALAS